MFTTAFAVEAYANSNKGSCFVKVGIVPIRGASCELINLENGISYYFVKTCSGVICKAKPAKVERTEENLCQVGSSPEFIEMSQESKENIKECM
jgi:ethanolamine utilization protein EutP (predicted NTPase)